MNFEFEKHLLKYVAVFQMLVIITEFYS